MKELEFQLARNVLCLANRIVAGRNEHIKELNLTAEQADSLLFFESHVDCTLTDLKDYLQITHQTARGIAFRMAEKKLIVLNRSKEDGRCKTIRLTTYGEKLTERLHENGLHTGSRLLAGMEEEDQIRFVSYVGLALKNLE